MKKQVDKTHYKGSYESPGRFISYYHQIKAISEETPGTILEIGIGSGTVANYLKNNGFNIETCDFDADLQPDHVADIRDLPFREGEFDLVTAFQVLEHLPFEDFEKAMSQLHKASSKTVIISIPYITLNIYWKCKCIPFLKPWYFMWRICELSFLKHKFNGEHYWEMGKKGFSRKKIRKILKKTGFSIKEEFTPEMFPYHYFFVLEKS
ncbi:MAG: class I SAM-dependent methyltransferase [Patescibacteria group bacterium]|nr:class I SAM-dependent methyltransferase [Patescibacteria group bacterium]